MKKRLALSVGLAGVSIAALCTGLLLYRPGALGDRLGVLASRLLPWLALAALIFCALFFFSPRGHAKLPAVGEARRSTLAWIASLFSVFAAANAPLFLLENVAFTVMPPAGAQTLSSAPSSPLAAAFPALATACLCAAGKKASGFFCAACAWLGSLVAVTLCLCQSLPVAAHSAALLPFFSGQEIPAWAVLLLCAAIYAALAARKKEEPLRFAAGFASLAFLLVFLTACGMGPLMRSIAQTIRAFAQELPSAFSNDGLALAYWLCWSPAIANFSVHASGGRGTRETVVAVYCTGFCGALLMRAVFGAYGLRLLESAAEAGYASLAPGKTLAQSIAKLFYALPYPSMDAALLALGMVLICISAMRLAIWQLPCRGAPVAAAGVLAAIPAFCVLLAGRPQNAQAILLVIALCAGIAGYAFWVYGIIRKLR